MAANVLTDVSDGVARLTLDRPGHSNAVDLATARELGAAVDLAAASHDVRAVLVAGAGPRFCAGGDVTSMVAADDRGAYLLELADTLDQTLRRLLELDKPVVAAVHGAVAGAGLALMLSCDLVVADPETRFVSAYSGVGLTPDCGLSWLLPRAVGQTRALELLLTARSLTAGEAHDWGLLTEVAPPGEAHRRAAEMAQLVADGPSRSLGQARRLVRTSWESSREATGRDESRTIAEAVSTEAAQVRLARFGSR